MKRILLLIALLGTLTAGAQKKMMIFLGNGEVRMYDKTEVDSVTFDLLDETAKYGGHEYVDLGLPSGLKWATCNLGADAPEEYGDFYAWAETETRTKFGNDNKYIVMTNVLKYSAGESVANADGKTVLEPEDDVACALWGGSWRMPTEGEMQELYNNCVSERVEQNSVKGVRFTGPNGNSIFFPLSGYSMGSTPTCQGVAAYYWSSSLYVYGQCHEAWLLNVNHGLSHTRRTLGCSVRAVAE